MFLFFLSYCMAHKCSTTSCDSLGMYSLNRVFIWVNEYQYYNVMRSKEFKGGALHFYCRSKLGERCLFYYYFLGLTNGIYRYNAMASGQRILLPRSMVLSILSDILSVWPRSDWCVHWRRLPRGRVRWLPASFFNASIRWFSDSAPPFRRRWIPPSTSQRRSAAAESAPRHRLRRTATAAQQ